jgi:nephrocystin-3
MNFFKKMFSTGSKPENNSSKTQVKKTIQDRTMRVSISSTFRDMQEDRDYLVKNVFPQLRKLCESRGVTWAEIDLRWGITDESAAEGKVLPICLEEIQKCRPYFIGLLGERYGWVPDTISPELLEKEEWLKEQFKDKKSVTELEILHGVLNNNDMENHAFFYFRDPKYVIEIEKSKQADFISTAADEISKLAQLKDKIRASGFPVQENYPNPEKLGELILKHLTKVIDDVYPEGSQPSFLDREKLDHEAYARSRSQVYIGREENYERLNQHAAKNDRQPLVILGESGLGKSALLANWAIQYSKENPDVLIIQHFVGSSTYSTDWARMLRRIMGELKRNTHIQDDIPSDNTELRDAFPVWLVNAAAQKKIILIIDALNQLEDLDFAPDLRWLPESTHPNLRLFLSTLPGKSLTEIEKRGWPTYAVQPLSVPEREKLIADFLNIYSRKLEDVRIKRIANATQSANPLYLRVLLDELRIFGIYEELDQRINHYLTAKTPIELYKLVIERWEKDYGKDEYKNKTTLVADTLTMVWSARHGLSEAEMLDILGSKEKPLARAFWSPLFLSMGDALVSKGGFLNFSHDYLKKAVEVKYLSGIEQQKQARLKLAGYFDRLETGNRKADELPWLFKQAEAKDDLRRVLLDIELFYIMRKNNEEELRGYWIWLGEEQTMGQPYLDTFKKWAADGIDEGRIGLFANSMGIFLDHAALYKEAEQLYRIFLKSSEKSFGKNHPDVATALNNLAILLKDTNRFSEAEPLYKKALKIREKSFGKNHPDVAVSLNSIGELLRATNRLSEAEPLYRRALEIDEKNFGKDHLKMAPALNNLALLLYDTNRLCEAEPLYRRSLEIFEKNYGKDHPDVAQTLNNLAELLRITNRLNEAELLCRRSLEIRENSFGRNHPHVAESLVNLGGLFKITNRLSEAEPLLRRSLEISVKSYGKDHPSVAISLNNLAFLLKDNNRFSEAEPLYRRSLEIREKSYGKDHPSVAKALYNLALLLVKTNRLNEAEPFFRRSLEIREKSYGKDHPDVVATLENIRSLSLEYYKHGDYNKAKELLDLLLTSNFEPLSINLHLARVCLMLNQNQDAQLHAEEAWKHREEAKSYILPRIIWFKAVFALLESESIGDYLGQLKTALQSEQAFMEWAMDPVLEHLKPLLKEKDHALITALVAALNDKNNLEKLNNFQEWVEADKK